MRVVHYYAADAEDFGFLDDGLGLLCLFCLLSAPAVRT